MKASTFENLIRKVVREEIDYALRREIKTLKEDLRSELKPTIIEHTERLTKIPETPKPFSKSIQNIETTPSPKKPIVNQNFTQNSSLNDMLNETAMGDTNTESSNPSVNMDQPFSSGAPLPMGTEGMPKEVADAVTRDYSGLMKAIDKKKGK